MSGLSVDPQLGVLISAYDGLVMFLLGLPLFFGWIPPNRIYGFRVKATLGDPKLWQWANRRAGARLMGIGVAIPLSATLAWMADLDPLLVGVAVMVLGCAWLVIRGWLEIREATRE